MTTSPRVLVTGASPDNENRNVTLRTYVAEGFQQLLGSKNVCEVSLEQAPQFAWRHKPNLVLCFGSCMPDDASYMELRQFCDATGALLAFWLHDDPYEFDFAYRAVAVADVVFSNDKWASLHYNHPRVHHMPLAASRSAHWRPPTSSKDFEIFFCGVAFPNRIRLVSDLKAVLSKHRTSILGDQWPTGQLPFARNRRLRNDQLSTHYSRSLVTLNMGRDFHYANDRFKLEPSTPGPRTFEAAMAGTTQLYFVESLEIEEYYAPQREIVLYDSVAEFERIVAMLIQDRATCFAIAMAAQERTLSDHTYRNRAQAIMDAVRPLRDLNAGEVA
jgi:spore maturation protein CgeB